ncbi:MAG: mechanosensitive ion channel [Thermoleophilia bacterium]|nr:mechanosensitive ion channel [Thermoleophilia bacterium]
MPSWRDVAVLAAAVLATAVLARLVDRRLARRPLPPEAVTRYRILRRSLMAAIVAVGVLSALLALPGVRPVAGGILASSAVLGLIVGFAAQSTLSNFVAGVVLAFTQPVRIGDRIEMVGAAGTVEEIGLTFTLIRLDDRSRLVIPNTRLASDTIRNSTIVSREKMAQVTVQVPLTQELGRVVELLRDAAAGEREPEVFVSALADRASVTVRARAADEAAALRLEHELRRRAHGRLRAAGIFE